MSSAEAATEPGPVGFAGKERLMAAVLDNAFAYLLAVIAVQAMEPSPFRWVVLVAIYLGYFVLSEALWSRTLGKAIFGLEVRSTDGGRCSTTGAVVRTLFRLLEVNPFVLGALPGGIAILLSSRKQRLGDKFGSTVVVRRPRPARPASRTR